jgi:acid phosphatase type 7
MKWTHLALAAVLGACGSTESASDPSAPIPDREEPPVEPPPLDPGTPQQEPPPDANPIEPWAPPVETGAVAFPYKAYRCGYSIRQVSPAKPTAMFHEDKSGAAPAPKNLHLTIAGTASSSVVVQWATDDATHATEVRFGEAPDKLVNVAHGFSFTYGVTNRRQHEVHLCGLSPGRTYYYDAGGAGGRGSVYAFTTAPDNTTDVTLLVAGDTRSNPSVWTGLAPKALAFGPTAMLLTGDAVATGTSQAQWDALFASAPELFARLPGIWAHGNHENLAEPYFAQLALPDHGGATRLEEWFATTYGPLRVVALNDTVSSGSIITGTQRTFLDTTLAAVDRTRTPFVFAMHHQPMYTTSSSHGSNTTIRGAWAPLFDQYHVNADLAGHVHSYESTLPLKGGTASSIGQTTTDAQGTRYFNYGGGGAPLYGFGTKPAWIQSRESVHGFAILKVTATQSTWTAYRADGSTIETLTLPK